MSKYDISLDFHKGTDDFTSFEVKGTTSPCYMKLHSTKDSYKLSDGRYDEITVKVSEMPKGGRILFQHAPFPTNYMDYRSRKVATQKDQTFTFKNYDQILILFVDNGDYKLEYKREFNPPDTPWRKRFNVYITMLTSTIFYLLYFIVFERTNTWNWLKKKLSKNDNKVDFVQGEASEQEE
jgi:hypothetical protein